MNQLRALAAFLGIVLAAAGGAYAGASLAERATQPGHERLVVLDPSFFEGPSAEPLQSAGGFTGFGGSPALGGHVVRTGTVEEADTPGDDAELLIVAEETGTTLRYRDASRLFRLVRAARPIEEGDILVVRLVDGEPRGVLRVPQDLEEGLGSSPSPRQRRSGDEQ